MSSARRFPVRTTDHHPVAGGTFLFVQNLILVILFILWHGNFADPENALFAEGGDVEAVP